VSSYPYSVDEEFQQLSYAKRYEVVCRRMVHELLYDAACFFTSNAEEGMEGKFIEPSKELSIRNFAISLHARAAAFAKIK
jgi:Restriction endonuclease XhoI